MGGCGGPSWRSFESPAGAYRAEFPAAPGHATRDLPSEGGVLRMDRDTAVVGELECTVAWVALPEAGRDTVSDPERLDGARDGSLGQLGASLVEERPLVVEGWPGREVVGRAGATWLRNRLVVTEDRLYQVLALHPDGAEAAAAARRFLESFQLRVPPPPAWRRFESRAAPVVAEAPGELVHSMDEAPTDAGVVTLQTYRLQHRGIEYALSVSPLGAAADGSPVAGQLEGARDGTRARLGGTLRRDEAREVAGAPARDFTLEVPGAEGRGLVYTARVMVHDGQLIQAACVHREGLALQGPVRRFLDSLRPLSWSRGEDP